MLGTHTPLDLHPSDVHPFRMYVLNTDLKGHWKYYMTWEIIVYMLSLIFKYVWEDTKAVYLIKFPHWCAHSIFIKANIWLLCSSCCQGNTSGRRDMHESHLISTTTEKNLSVLYILFSVKECESPVILLFLHYISSA